MLTEVKNRIGEKNRVNLLRLWQDPIYRQKMVAKHRGRKMPSGCDRTGTIPWNKGLSSETSFALKELSEARTGIGNPMFGKGAWNSGKKLPQFSGENHPNWVKDRTKIKAYQSERNNAEYKQWRMRILEIYNWQCVMCGERKKKIIADHIYSWANYPRLRYCDENGQTLCFDCHKIKTRYENMLNTNIIYSTIWEK